MKCTCPKRQKDGKVSPVNRDRLCPAHGEREQTDVIAELHAEIERLKAQLKDHTDER